MDQYKNNLNNLNLLYDEYKVICSTLNILFHSMKKIDEESTKLESDNSYGEYVVLDFVMKYITIY